MSGNKLLRFGVPVASQAAPGVSVPVRSQTGQCGISPYKPPPPPPPQIIKIPDHLIRPPCLPGSEAARLPPDCSRNTQGFFCPPQRLKYKYPPFSENIDFVPTGSVDCWWTRPKNCDLRGDEEEDLPIKLP